LTTIQHNYVNASQSRAEKLYRDGLDELRFALSDPGFLREHLANCDSAAIDELRRRIDRVWTKKPADDLRDLRQYARDLAWEAQELTGLNPNVAVLELACGACHALDDYSRFIYTGRSAIDSGTIESDLAAFGMTVVSKHSALVIER